jgi:hypothetical protein
MPPDWIGYGNRLQVIGGQFAIAVRIDIDGMQLN